MFINVKVPPKRHTNAARRLREYLTEKEVDQLTETARKRGRYRHRDTTAILIDYRHALHVLEFCVLRWDSIDLESGLMRVRRLKNGTPRAHMATLMLRTGGHLVNVGECEDSARFDAPEFPVIHPA